MERTSLEQEYEATLEKQGGEVNPETLQRYQEELAEVDARLADAGVSADIVGAEARRFAGPSPAAAKRPRNRRESHRPV